ncbi:glutathione S-transferase family protein [Jannaschia aquimarina]|uniref:YfcG_1 protein n=1 Tax=Jannaschia aquimarina TaxID=935700 RepID=A0A0D1CTY9_9RHOB|nr:glutathione S-transferase N-terminal domain-containing protein [Jannaschia aquimarina]KIT18232.1 Disulfide-bond oxidoreductase YfcG [Jannaschia aquimarina]SNS82820.1 GST-like protein [Jannaschia aquimarina]
MIVLYAWDTPNGQKPAILLEELGVDYDLRAVDIGKGAQDDPAFRAISPNGKIPALVDGDVTLFESGAILLHLAVNHGRFLPTNGQARADALAWTFWQVGGLGPMIGQWGHFLMADGDHTYARERYLAETLRLYGVLEGRLAKAKNLAGPDYSIADMMVFPWAKGGLGFLEKAAADRLPDLPATRAWIERIAGRPAVAQALERMAALEGGAR